MSDFLLRTGLDAHIQPKATSGIENKSLNPLVCEYLAQFPAIYMTEHDNHPKHNLEKYKSSEPWLFDPRKDYLEATRRRSILDHFEAENRNLHANYFPGFPYELLFGMSNARQNIVQQKSPKPLENQQLEFLESWVGKWLRSKNTRVFFLSQKRLVLSIKRYFSRSI